MFSFSFFTDMRFENMQRYTEILRVSPWKFYSKFALLSGGKAVQLCGGDHGQRRALCPRQAARPIRCAAGQVRNRRPGHAACRSQTAAGQSGRENLWGDQIDQRAMQYCV